MQSATNYLNSLFGNTSFTLGMDPERLLVEKMFRCKVR